MLVYHCGFELPTAAWRRPGRAEQQLTRQRHGRRGRAGQGLLHRSRGIVPDRLVATTSAQPRAWELPPIAGEHQLAPSARTLLRSRCTASATPTEPLIAPGGDRQSAVKGPSVSVGVDIGGRRTLNKK